MNRFCRYSLLTLAALAAFVGVPRLASAAPFCVEIRGMTPQCAYFDAAQCRERAHELNGICSANSDELSLVQGSGQFCMITSTHATSCIYPDMQSCNAVALKEGSAVCVEGKPREPVEAAAVPGAIGAPPATDFGIPKAQGQDIDPYRADPERRY